MIYTIVAMDENRGIGKNNKIPWKLKSDLKFFTDITKKVSSNKNNAVIMGRLTWESIPEKYKPLSDRINIIISNTLNNVEGTLIFNNVSDCMSYLNNRKDIQNIFFIGGESIYKESFNLCEKIFITKVYGCYNCDKFFPIIPKEKFYKSYSSGIKRENNTIYKYVVYKKIF